MSGNGVSPIPDDKVLAYIYDDVDDSDIFALESQDINFTKADTKNDDNKECTDTQASELSKENENLKAVINQLQLEKDTLERRISEIYVTAKTEIERKDRRIQELNEEKNNILFRRNKNFVNRQPQPNNKIADTAKPNHEKELTNEEFQRFSVTYKIPKKENLDDKDSGQQQRISVNLPRPVLEDEEELKTVPRNERHHNPRHERQYNQQPFHNKDSCSPVEESSNTESKENGCHISSEKSSFYGNRSRSRNRSEYPHRRSARTLSGSPPVKNEYIDYKNHHKIMDDEEQKAEKSIIVEESSDSRERADIKNGIKYQQRRKSNSETGVQNLNKDHTRVKNMTYPRTPSESPPRQFRRSSRSPYRERIDEKSKYRSKSRHRGPVTPPGSPSRDLRYTPEKNLDEKNYRSRKKYMTDSKSPHDISNRQKANFSEQNEIQNRENSKQIFKKDEMVDIIKTEDIHYVSDEVVSKKKENDLQEADKIRTVNVKKDEEKQCRSMSKVKQVNLQEEVKVGSCDTGKDKEIKCRSKSKEKDRKDKRSDKMLINKSDSHEKSSENDGRSISIRRHSRRSRSRSRETQNRRQNYQNNSRSKDRYPRSGERDRYRKDFKEGRPRIGNLSNRNNISNFDQGPVRRDRYIARKDWRNRNRDYPQNMNSRRYYRENHMRPNFSRLREKVLRYSLERAPEALKTNKGKKGLIKENDTDHSDLDDLRLHLSGASDEVSSTEDVKEGKHNNMDVDDNFELVKHLGTNIPQMDDDELERLLQGRRKELEATYEDLEDEKVYLKQEPVFSYYEENPLTEVKDSDDMVKVSPSVDMQDYNKQTGVKSEEFSVKDKEESIHRNQKASNDIEHGVMYSENANNTCQQTFKTIFEERQCMKQKTKQNQRADEKIVRHDNNNENNKECEKHESEYKIIREVLPKVQNKFETIQHVKKMEKQNRNENNLVKGRNTHQKIQEKKCQTPKECKSKSSDLYEETYNNTSRKKSYSSIMETIEEAKTKHIDFLLNKRDENVIKEQYTMVKCEDAEAHSGTGTPESKTSPSEETSQYRDPRQNSSSKDLREKSAKEKEECDAHSRQKKIKIGLDVYKKRKKADEIVAVNVHCSEATTEPVPMNDEYISKSKNSNEMPADMLHTSAKTTSESNKDVDISPRDKINNGTSVHPGIQKVAEGSQHPNKKENSTDSKTVNEIKSIPENSVTNIKNQTELEYSPVVSDEDDDENVIPVQEYSKESAVDVRDTSSFLHDFSLSEDEDTQTGCYLLKNNTNRDVGKNEKIKILDVTIVKPSFISAPERSPTKNRIEPASKFDHVVVHSGLINTLQPSECIEQIQEAVDMKDSDKIIALNNECVQNLDTEELEKFLEEDHLGAKDELRMQDEGPAKKKSVHKIGKDRDNRSDRTAASQDIKTEKQRQEERMLLLFGKSPSPRPPTSTASEKSNANSEQLKKVKKNLVVEPTQNIKIENRRNVHKKKTTRSKSLDEGLCRKQFIEGGDFEETPTKDQSKSFNNERVTDSLQYPLFCNNPTYIPNLQNPGAFDSPNRYIRKKIDEYKERNGVQIKDKRDIIPASKGLVKKPNQISEPEKKNRSKNASFKIKIFPNKSLKRKGAGDSEECRQTKKKKVHHALLGISDEDQSFSSDSETSSTDDEIRVKNKGKSKDKSTKVPNRESKNNGKRKKSVEAQNGSGKLNTSTESVRISSSQSELNISNEMKCEQEECKTKVQKKGRKKSVSKERGGNHQETADIEQHCNENITETGVVLRRGGRIRKQPGFYQSMLTEVSSNDEPSSKAACKSKKRRITPIKVGDSNNKVSENINKAQSINTSGGSDKTSTESNKSAVNRENSKLVEPSKRKLHLNEKAKHEKLPGLDDRGPFENLEPIPLPNIQETLKQCEMKMCETVSDTGSEEVPVISTGIAATDCGKQNRSFNDSSLPEINLDTKDADLLGTFERGLLENMNEYLCDKSVLSLGSEGRPKSDKDSNSATNEVPIIQNTEEGVNQVAFCNFLIHNTNTSTPIKISNEEKQNKANIISVQMIAPRSESVASTNNSHDKISQGMSNSSSNTAILTKSYLASPLKRDRRRRIDIVMVDVT